METYGGDRIHSTAIFGRVVALVRREFRLSQEELGRALGADRSRVCRVEVGRNTATLDDVMGLEAVFRALGLAMEPGTLVRVVADVTDTLAGRGGHGEKGKSDESCAVDVRCGMALDWVILSALRKNGCWPTQDQGNGHC